mmetsp:Transcript_15950/g.34453  ORF Transcript_15950/g.34453 Transcript_15950/m.34453 type:complete len:117 (+) Transcript_15950:79-429(+)
MALRKPHVLRGEDQFSHRIVRDRLDFVKNPSKDIKVQIQQNKLLITVEGDLQEVALPYDVALDTAHADFGSSKLTVTFNKVIDAGVLQLRKEGCGDWPPAPHDPIDVPLTVRPGTA